MKKNLTKLCYAMCAVMLLCHLNACRDPVITDVGNTLNLKSVSLYHVDSCTIAINTVPDRPLAASGVTQGVLGSLNDIFFGKTYAGIYAQCLLLNGLPPSFAGCVVDSAVLVMPFIGTTGVYGKCNKPVDIQIYEVSQAMVPGTTYYTNDAFSVNPLPIGQRLNYVADPRDSVYFVDPTQSPVPYIGLAPELRVRLSNAFANQLLNANDTDYLASATFIEFFPGIYITTNPNKVGDGLMYFSLGSTALNLYYHHASYTPIDTAIYQFGISTYGVTVNHFDHYYGGTLVQGAMNTQTPNGNTVGYIQAGGGSRIKMTFPYLKNLPASLGNIGITKAELIMPILDTLVSDPSYPPPSSITMTRIDDTLAVDPLNDNDYSGNVGTSGIGILTTRLDNNGQSYVCYVFNITLYVQRVLNGYYSNNNGYYVSYSNSSLGDRTIILNQKTKLSTRCQLNITYTKLQ